MRKIPFGNQWEADFKSSVLTADVCSRTPTEWVSEGPEGRVQPATVDMQGLCRFCREACHRALFLIIVRRSVLSTPGDPPETVPGLDFQERSRNFLCSFDSW